MSRHGTPKRAPRNSSPRAWRALRQVVLDRDGHCCQICGAPANDVAPIRPVAHGDRTWPGNLRAICQRCNPAKGDR